MLLHYLKAVHFHWLVFSIAWYDVVVSNLAQTFKRTSSMPTHVVNYARISQFGRHSLIQDTVEYTTLLTSRYCLFFLAVQYFLMLDRQSSDISDIGHQTQMPFGARCRTCMRLGAHLFVGFGTRPQLLQPFPSL